MQFCSGKGIRKLVAVVCGCVALALCICLTACSSSSSSKNYSLVNDGVLTVATSPDAQPFEYYENDEIVGFDVDVVKEIAKRLDLDVSIQQVQFSEIKRAIEAGSTYDVAIASLSIPSENQENISYSNAYFYGDNAIVIPQEITADEDTAALVSSAGASSASQSSTSSATSASSTAASTTAKKAISSESDLKDKKIAAVANTSQYTYVKENYTENIISCSSYRACLEAVANGEADAAVLEYQYAKSVVESSYPTLKLMMRIATSDSYGIMLSSKNSELLSAINDAISAMSKDGTLSSIEQKYNLL